MTNFLRFLYVSYTSGVYTRVMKKLYRSRTRLDQSNARTYSEEQLFTQEAETARCATILCTAMSHGPFEMSLIHELSGRPYGGGVDNIVSSIGYPHPLGTNSFAFP